MALIGIMGGTFNPIHFGHIEIAKSAYKQYNLDEIWFMPNHIPAYKQEDKIVSGQMRLHMVQLAIEKLPYCKISDFELKREGNTYTIDTLKLLTVEYPEHQFYFIMGADSLFSFDKWREYKEIPKYAQLLVAPRDEKSRAEVSQKLLEWNHFFGTECFYRIDCQEIPCSSSEIREWFSGNVFENVDKDNKARELFLSREVFDYILEKQLYV